MARKQSRRWEDLDKFDVVLEVLRRHFEVHNKTAGKSPRTVEWYNDVLRLFRVWLKQNGLSTSPGSLGEMEVRQFVLHLQEKPGAKGLMSSHSIANRVRALRAFFSWLARNAYKTEYRLKNLKSPKTVELIIEPFAEEEIDRVLSAINPNTALRPRNTALVLLMLDTGVRLSEAATLKEQDVHLEDRYIKVLRKGSKERIVAFGVACQRALLHYSHHFRVSLARPGVENIFLTIDGYPLKSEGIKSMMDRLAKSANVPRMHPHLLRHTYATNFLLNGGAVFLLKQNLGHSTSVMVENFLHIAGRSAAVRSQSFSPLDRMKVKDNRRFRHSFTRDGDMNGHVYPNARIPDRRTQTRKRK